jgi:hypothetical protein
VYRAGEAIAVSGQLRAKAIWGVRIKMMVTPYTVFAVSPFIIGVLTAPAIFSIFAAISRVWYTPFLPFFNGVFNGT